MAFSLFSRKPKPLSPPPPATHAAPPPPPKPSFPPPPFMLNLGCGACYHPAWVNIDFVPHSPDVHQHDLNTPLPLPDNSATVVYHSHVLEHFTRAQAAVFLRECFRVLSPGGIIRVAVPDLETIARLYLANLEAAASGEGPAKNRHEWMTIEMIDQLAREFPGGEMGAYWRRSPMPEEGFVLERLGREVGRFLEYFRSLPPEEQEKQRLAVPPPANPGAIGQFRLSGEPHKWMYDRVSLKDLLESCGFEEVRRVSASTSAIADFASYGLDLHSDRTIRKPDSLFMEGWKPS